jgi:Cu+-exporting ATPase
MGRIGVYFEAAAVIISLTLLGQMLELRARSQTSAAIKSLLGLAPKTARRIWPGRHAEEDVPLSHVHVGDCCVCARRESAGRRRGGRRLELGR